MKAEDRHELKRNIEILGNHYGMSPAAKKTAYIAARYSARAMGIYKNIIKSFKRTEEKL